MLEELRTEALDLRHFGAAVMKRHFGRPDASGRVVINTRFGSFIVRPSNTDMKVLREVYVYREYDLDRFPQGALIRRSYERALATGKTPLIIDAGANAGFVARFFAAAYPQARIISVEPDPGNAAICRANTSGLPMVEVVEAAIGSRPGHVALEQLEGHGWATRTRRMESGLAVVTVDQLRARVPDSELLIVKVDIEGFELDLFSENIGWIPDTCAVIAEPHDWMLPDLGSSQSLQRAMLGEGRDLLISHGNLVWVKR